MGRKPLPEETVFGNIFFTLLAGHETTGSTLGFVFVLLTLYPESQKRILEELDKQFGGRPISDWSVEKDSPALQNGYLGAVQKEILNIYNPVSFFTRTVLDPVSVTDSKGQSYQLPLDMLALFNNAAAARNPTVWEHPILSFTRRHVLSDSPALYFNSNRWLGTNDEPDDTDRNDQNVPT